jgi:hypothetical protein
MSEKKYWKDDFKMKSQKKIFHLLPQTKRHMSSGNAEIYLFLRYRVKGGTHAYHSD